MENKYYTPEVSDLFVGYECEVGINRIDEGSEHATFRMESVTLDEEHLEKILKACRLSIVQPLQVPYLTEEQIESEGWYYHGKFGSGFQLLKKHPQLPGNFYMVTYYPEDRMMVISRDTQSHEDIRFFVGNCPSINEFRKICKLLNI